MNHNDQKYGHWAQVTFSKNFPTFSSVTCSSTSAPSFFPTKYDLLTRPFGTQITENNGMTVKNKKEAFLGSFREYFHGFLVLIDF